MTTPSRPGLVQPEVTVSSRVVSELVRAVETAGVPRSEFLRVAKIEPAWLEGDDFRLSRTEVSGLCQVALDITRDPAFGLHWGEWLTTSSFTVISHLIAHASNLRQAFETLQRFEQLVTDDIGIELVETEDTAELRSIDKTEQPPAVRRLTAEMVTLGFLRLIQHYGGPNAGSVYVCFEYPAPEYRAEYTRLFEGAERFDQPFTGLVFARALLHAQSPEKDVDLYATLSDLAERRLLRLQGRAPWCVRIRQHLMQQRAPHRVALRQVARSLGLSPRSLHRRLAEEQQSFVALANEASAQLAKKHIDAGRTMKETAHAMGFTNVSSFHRAFRRWTGTTPGAFREQSTAPRTRHAG